MVHDPSECFQVSSVIELFSAEHCVDETSQGFRKDWACPRASELSKRRLARIASKQYHDVL
jgi:hypothetical protein